MDGQNNPEIPEPNHLEAKQAQDTQETQRKSFFKRFRKPIAAATGITLAASSALGIREVTKDSSPPENPDMEPSPAQTIDNTPNPTGQVVEITPTPIEVSLTPQVTPTATAENPTPAPTPVETQKPKNYDIIDRGILNPDYPAYESITKESAIKVIEGFFENYPVLSHPHGNLKIEVILGGGNWYFPNEHRIVADRASANFEEKFLHEVVHSWDNVIKTNPDLLETRSTVLNDPQIGRHYPNIETLMSSQYIPVLTKFMDENANLNLDELQDLASNQADGFWIREESNDPLSIYFLEDSLSQKSGGFESMSQFLEDIDIKKIIEGNNHWAYVSEIIKSDPQKWEAYIEKIHPSLSYQHDSQEYIKAFVVTGRLILAEKLMRNSPDIQDLFSQEQIASVMPQLEARKNRADEEMLAEIISKWIYLKEAGRLSNEFNTSISNFISEVRTVHQSN